MRCQRRVGDWKGDYGLSNVVELIDVEEPTLKMSTSVVLHKGLGAGFLLKK